jgi:uncharacterized protein DUF4440
MGRFTIRAGRALMCGALLLTGSCISAIIAANKAREMAAVEWTLRNFNQSLTRGDTIVMRTLVRPDYRLVEDSVEYDVASAVTAVSSAHAAGKISREISDLKIEQRGKLAWATYHVHAMFVTGRDTLRFTRLESAVLERTDVQWMIAFMTSNPSAP